MNNGVGYVLSGGWRIIVAVAIAQQQRTPGMFKVVVVCCCLLLCYGRWLEVAGWSFEPGQGRQTSVKVLSEG